MYGGSGGRELSLSRFRPFSESFPLAVQSTDRVQETERDDGTAFTELQSWRGESDKANGGAMKCASHFGIAHRRFPTSLVSLFPFSSSSKHVLPGAQGAPESARAIDGWKSEQKQGGEKETREQFNAAMFYQPPAPPLDPNLFFLKPHPPKTPNRACKRGVCFPIANRYRGYCSSRCKIFC